MTRVDANTLRQGAWYALEQAGRLLVASATVADSGDRVTAVVLAMFGREEIGRSKLLRDLAARVDSGQGLHADDVRKFCDDHVQKQSAGNLSTTLRSQSPSALDAAARRMFAEVPGNAEHAKADQVGQLAAAAKRKRDPGARHSARMACLYVDIDDSNKWQRPVTWSQSDAQNLIFDAITDYACERDRLESFPDDVPEMSIARTSLEPGFHLPLPPRPKWAV